ncbi:MULTISPECIES: response regulator [unclassified Rhizobium]|uniref:response regulator n=1 Tax=unclassified Rhizobium TaxID=2613769 RepID=UPI000EA94F10|nr:MULTISPECIES: response regulator [unclassified Rhizobium]AYG64642.1 response regulator [Rhizobium sp. CCGE531]AYG71124.1 response regulator [Rhizobium sp. CCGE532]
MDIQLCSVGKHLRSVRMKEAEMPPIALIGIVDDDAEFLAALGSLVRSLGCEVECFSSAELLVNRANLPDFACVISDINMPKVDGLELIDILRHKAEELPIILMTGRGASDLEEKAYGCGARGFVTKPFGFEELASSLMEIGVITE